MNRVPGRYQIWSYQTWIGAAWCYYWRHKVTLTRTRADLTGTDDVPAWVTISYRALGDSRINLIRCGWESGYSPDNPYEIIWQYQPSGTTGSADRLDWGYTSSIIAQYGSPEVYFRNHYFPACTYIFSTNRAGIIIDWEGQGGPW